MPIDATKEPTGKIFKLTAGNAILVTRRKSADCIIVLCAGGFQVKRVGENQITTPGDYHIEDKREGASRPVEQVTLYKAVLIENIFTKRHNYIWQDDKGSYLCRPLHK